MSHTSIRTSLAYVCLPNETDTTSRTPQRGSALTVVGLLAQQVADLLQELLGGAEVLNGALGGLLGDDRHVVDSVEVVNEPAGVKI